MHDMMKYGHPPAGSHTESEHDRICADLLQKKTDLPQLVLRMVRTHNGCERWGASIAPRNDAEQIHHLADMFASMRAANIGVWNPHEVLEERFDLIEANSDDLVLDPWGDV